MTDDVPAEIGRIFERNDAIEHGTEGFIVTTTAFESTVRVDGSTAPPTYTVTVIVPTLAAATTDEVGPTVAESWLETLERRLADAPKATRATVDLEAFSVEEDGDVVRIEYSFTRKSPDSAAEIAKTFAEYVEGTYVEGIIPGYDYVPPVADLLADASQSGEGGTPL